LLLAIEGIGDRNAAERFVGATLYARKDAIELADGEFLDADLAGCNVVDERSGRNYGIVERVDHFPASDMLVVNGKWIPMVDAIVKAVDVRKREVVVDPPLGLLDEE
jgi:16S rRNA processing protein RimM